MGDYLEGVRAALAELGPRPEVNDIAGIGYALAEYRRAVINQAKGGPPGDGQWAYPEELELAVRRAENALLERVKPYPTLLEQTARAICRSYRLSTGWKPVGDYTLDDEVENAWMDFMPEAQAAFGILVANLKASA